MVPYDDHFAQALNGLKRPGLGIAVMPLSAKPGAALIELTFEDTDSGKAQSDVKSTITTLVEGMVVKRVEPHATMNLEVVDNASLPFSPVSPNRFLVSFLGLCVGFVAAAIGLLIQSRRAPKLA